MDRKTENVPSRSYMDDQSITWRHAKPDYSLVNKKYLNEKSKTHAAGSLEKIVEDLVKTWEMESTHKCVLNDWQTIVKDGTYYFQVNGGKKFTAEDNVVMGNYNMMLVDSAFIDVTKETHDSSHKLFKDAFPHGFAWEVLEVYSVRSAEKKKFGIIPPPTATYQSNRLENSVLKNNLKKQSRLLYRRIPEMTLELLPGAIVRREQFQRHFHAETGPPKVSFTWRHWTTWTGPYLGQKPTGEKLEMIGSCIAEVTKDFKLKYIQVFFDPNPIMMKLTGTKCPIMS